MSMLLSRIRSALHPKFSDASLARLAKLRYLGIIGVLGHPLYYFIWKHVLPQPYESLTLRAVVTVLFIPLIFSPQLSGQAWLRPYSFFAITVGLPMTFVYLYLMNGANLVWSESLLGAVIILYHLGATFATLSMLIGGGCALLFYMLTQPTFLPQDQTHILEQIPILGFFAIVMFVIKLDREVLFDAKQRGMASALASVAHELRTPLASIQSTLAGFERHLPKLIAASPDAATSGERLMAAMHRMQVEVRTVHASIDLLLANSKDQNSIPRTNFDLSNAVRQAIADYPFYDHEPRNSIQLNLAAGLIVTGNEAMFRMVLNNLLKNALRAIARAGRGTISISATEGARGGAELQFGDTAEGIRPEVLRRIFERFYTYPSGSGNGIGLPFCRDVLEQWGATIACQSEYGKQTIFTLTFPPPRPPSVATVATEQSV